MCCRWGSTYWGTLPVSGGVRDWSVAGGWSSVLTDSVDWLWRTRVVNRW